MDADMLFPPDLPFGAAHFKFKGFILLATSTAFCNVLSTLITYKYSQFLLLWMMEL